MDVRDKSKAMSVEWGSDYVFIKKKKAEEEYVDLIDPDEDGR